MILLRCLSGVFPSPLELRKTKISQEKKSVIVNSWTRKSPSNFAQRFWCCHEVGFQIYPYRRMSLKCYSTSGCDVWANVTSSSEWYVMVGRQLFCSGSQKLPCRRRISPPFLLLLWLASAPSAARRQTRPRVTGLVWGQRRASHLATWEILDLWGHPASVPAPWHGAVRNLRCTTGLPADRVYIRGMAAAAAGRKAEGAVALNDRLRSVLWKAMLRFFSSGTPVDIFEGVIVGNHRIALRFKGSIFKYNQYSIQLLFFFF